MKFCPYCGASLVGGAASFAPSAVNKSQYMGQKAHPCLRFGNIAL